MDRPLPVENVIQETQTWLEQYQALKRADLGRLHSELATLEARRTDLTERVSQDNADRGSQTELNRTEQAIAGIKDQIAALREEVRQTVLDKRREASEMLNREVTELQEEIGRSRGEKEKIRTELLPALELQREQLIERGKELENDILHLTERISVLSRIDIESEDLEFD